MKKFLAILLTIGLLTISGCTEVTPKEKIVYVDRIVEVEKEIIIEKEVEVPVYIDKIIEIEKEIIVEKEVEVPIYIEKEIIKEVEVIVEKEKFPEINILTSDLINSFKDSDDITIKNVLFWRRTDQAYYFWIYDSNEKEWQTVRPSDFGLSTFNNLPKEDTFSGSNLFIADMKIEKGKITFLNLKLLEEFILSY